MGNPPHALKRIAKAGFTHVEIWSDPSGVLSGYLDELFSNLENNGLEAFSIHAPFTGLDVSSIDDRLRKRSVEQILDAMDTAEKLRCKHIIVHPGSAKYERSSYDKARRLLAKSAEELATVAEARGLTLALENMLTSKDGLRVGTRVGELREVIESLSIENLGICLDTGHAHYNGLDVSRETKNAGDLLIDLHVNDNDGTKDQHKVPGEGTINWPSFTEALWGTKYRGIFTLEIYGEDEVPKRLEKSYKAASRLLNL